LGTIYKHPLQSYRNIVYTFLTYNLNQNSNCYALKRHNDYRAKNSISGSSIGNRVKLDQQGIKEPGEDIKISI